MFFLEKCIPPKSSVTYSELYSSWNASLSKWIGRLAWIGKSFCFLFRLKLKELMMRKITFQFLMLSNLQLQAWWYVPIVPVLERLRYEFNCHEFKPSLWYIVQGQSGLYSKTFSQPFPNKKIKIKFIVTEAF